MSENRTLDQSLKNTDAVCGAATAGVLLKTAREAQGLHIDAMAVTLKVPVHKLEALEADRFDVLVDVVFARALAASFCRVLKIDATPVLAALPHVETHRLKTDESGLNTPLRTGRGVFGLSLKSRLASPLGLAVVLLVFGIFLIAMLPGNEIDEAAPTKASVVDAQVVLPAVSPVEIVAPIAPVPAVLQLQSRGGSWVEITDAQGVLQLRKMLEPGEQVQSQGPMPLSVVLGRADEVAVSVRGQPLDITAMTKANIARFEVK